MSTMDQVHGSQDITRREFLRLSSLGLLAGMALTLPGRRYVNNLFSQLHNRLPPFFDITETIYPIENISPNQLGRVLDAAIDIFDIPSFDGTRLSSYYRDQIIPISGLTVGKSEDSFNMVWYKVGEEGYAHSGSIQPVFTITNAIPDTTPTSGAVAEVTVPFTDARWDPGEDQRVAYRFYYATTYWVVERVEDENGQPWYGVRDDKWEYIFYVPAAHMRIIPPEETAPISPHVPPEMKRIEVHLPEQVLIAYEYDEPVFMARVATGAKFSNGDYSTPTGQYTTFHKRYSRHMARGNLAANGYDLPGVPWNSYITEEGIAFHGTYWHNNFGRPRSHGCINLSPQAAKWVYLWTTPIVPPDQEGVYKKTGTAVEVIG